MVGARKTCRIAHGRDYSLARLQKDNQEITRQIVSYLSEPHHPVRMASIYALALVATPPPSRARSAFETDELSIVMAPMIKGQIARLKKPAEGKPGTHPVAKRARNLPMVAREKRPPPTGASKNSNAFSRK